jgi:hypothetical protein
MESIRDRLAQLDFVDAMVERLRREGDVALIDYRDWRGRRFRLRFAGVVFLKVYDFDGPETGRDVGEAVGGFPLSDVTGGGVAGEPELAHLSFVGEGAMAILVARGLEVTAVERAKAPCR